MATPTYELLDSTTLTSSASSVSFTNIDQSFGDLVVFVSNLQSETSSTFRAGMRLNGDTGTNYWRLDIWGAGSLPDSTSDFNSYARLVQENIDQTSRDLYEIHLLDYSATDKQTNYIFETSQFGNENKILLGSGRYNSNSAITSIEIMRWTGTGTLGTGSVFQLFGIAK